MQDKCNICSAGDIGRLWTRDVNLGKKNIYEMSVRFGCSKEEAMEHVNKHDIMVDESGNYESPDFYIGKLLKILKTLEDMINYDMIMNTKMTSQDKEITIKVLKECRETLKSLGEFQGRLSSSKDMTINLALISQNYRQITNMLVTEVCPECRQKVINMLDQMDTPAQIT